MRPGRVDGKSVVITGAARGIDRASAEVFAREGAVAASFITGAILPVDGGYLTR